VRSDITNKMVKIMNNKASHKKNKRRVAKKHETPVTKSDADKHKEKKNKTSNVKIAREDVEQKSTGKISNVRKIFVGLTITVLLLTMVFVYIAKTDTALDAPEIFVQNQTSKVIDKKYFNIVLSRIPLNSEVYDPSDLDMNYTLGADISQDKLNFGIIPINAPATKSLKLSNNRDGDIKIKIITYGNISQYIALEKNNFILKPNKEEDLNVYFKGAESAGILKGELDVMIIIPNSPLSGILMWMV